MSVAFAWSQIRMHPGRVLAVVAAIALATGFLAATATFASTAAAGLRLTAAAPLSAADIVVDRAGGDADPGWFHPLADRPGIATVDPQYARTVDVSGRERRGTATALSIPESGAARWFDLTGGRWPRTADELVADRRTLEDLGVVVGDTISVRHGREPARTVVVTGVADLGFQPLTGSAYRLYAGPAFFAGDTPPLALLRVEDGAAVDAIVEALDASLPIGLSASSAAVQAEQAAARFAGGTTQLTAILAAFAAIALLAATMVLTGTFQVLVAQRSRQVALLRLIGAHRSQVRDVVLAEAGILGCLGALVGVLAGVGVGYLAASTLALAGAGPRLNGLALAGSFLIGVAATATAAWLPARRATRVRPIAALGVATTAAASSPGRGRAVGVLGLVATTAGALTMIAAVVVASLPLALLGGVACAVGLLAGLPRIIASALPGVDALLGRLGVSAGLAGSNLRRNPRRTASAVLAMILGTTLITALGVAARSGQSTVDADLDARYPVDVSVHTDGAAVAQPTFDAIAALPQIELAERISTREARILPAGATAPTRIARLPTALAGAVAPQPDGPDGSLLLPAAYLREAGLQDGSPVTVVVDGTEHGFTARASRLADSTGQLIGIVDEQRFAEIGGTGAASGVWAVARDGADLAALQEQVAAIAAADPDITVGGSLDERRGIADTLSLLVGLSLAMLLITIVIAVLGISTVLSLSVVERGRELALLRALGARRGRIRTTLAIEAVTLTTLGSVVGVLIGVPVGLVGLATAVGRTAPTVVDLPLAQLALIILAAAATGVLASLLPARRATRIAPAAGLVRP